MGNEEEKAVRGLPQGREGIQGPSANGTGCPNDKDRPRISRKKCLKLHSDKNQLQYEYAVKIQPEMAAYATSFRMI